jgi:hypothetical protein
MQPNWAYVVTTSPVSSNQWYQVVATYDGSRSINGMLIYVNGINQDTINFGYDPTEDFTNALNPYIGARATDSTVMPFGGYIDEVAVYNRTLSPSDVSKLYERSSAGKHYCSEAPVAAPAAEQAAPAPVIATFNLDTIENFISFTGTALELKKDDTISFSIHGTSHTVRVLEVNLIQNTVTLLIQSNPLTLTFEEGETKQIDTNGDGFNDLEIEFRGIVNGNADVVFRKIAACGDNVCDETESIDVCCVDCGCSGEKQCINSACILVPVPAPPVRPGMVIPSLPAYIKSSVIYDMSRNAAVFAITCMIIVFAIILVLLQRIIIKLEKQAVANYIKKHKHHKRH